MRNLCDPHLAKFRDHEADRLFGTKDEERALGGAFLVLRNHHLQRVFLRVIASTGEGWDHVSVSLSDRCPTWAEMEFIKRLFFEDDETAFQLHVPPRDHVNNHPFCLHLWRPQTVPIPRPPAILVGLPESRVAEQLPLGVSP
jgi:hypothetical protein